MTFILMLAMSVFAEVKAQEVKVAAKKVTDFPSGVPSDQLIGGNIVLAFIKGPSKRTLYVPGSFVRIKTKTTGKIKGYISHIGDTAVVVNGIKCSYKDIVAYYVPMRLCSIFGTALCVAGGGYMIFDAVNGAINNLDPPFHGYAAAVGVPLMAGGAVLLAFTYVKRSTTKWHVKAMYL